MNTEAVKNVVSDPYSLVLYGAIIALGGRIVYDWFKGHRSSKDQEIISHIRNTCNWLREEHGRVKEKHEATHALLEDMRDSLNRLVTLQEKK